MEQQYEKDWGDFTRLHPELVGNQELTNELIDEMDAIAYAAERRGKTLTMAEGLQKAWISLGKQAADDKEKIVNKTKEQASKPAPGASKPKQNSGKQEFTAEQIAVAKKMGISAEDLAKYSK
jgi:phage I-like protein